MKNKRQTILILTSLLVILIVLAMYFGVRRIREASVDSFEDCVAAGYPVAESYPRQCHTPDGRGFTEDISIK